MTENAGARGRVLVIDDDAFVLRAIGRVLAQHEVVAVADGPAALAAIDRGAPFGVVLCDVELPGMDVTVLWRELATRRPSLLARVVFVTGGILTPAHERFLAQSGRPVIDKPFHIADLRDAVARQLAARVWPALPFMPEGLGGSRTPAAIDPPAARTDRELSYDRR